MKVTVEVFGYDESIYHCFTDVSDTRVCDGLYVIVQCDMITRFPLDRIQKITEIV